VQCQFGDRTVTVPLHSTPQPLSGLKVYAAGEPLPGVHLELRLPRTTFVAGALIQPEVAVRNTSASDASVVVRVSALPQNAPADPRSFPIFSGGPGPAPPLLDVPPGETRTVSSLLQVPFDAAEPVRVHAVARLGGVTVVADVPLELTVAGPAQQLKIELHADARQWCAQATDGNGRAPSGALLAAMIARGAGMSMQGGATGATAGAAWAGRFPSNLPTSGPLTVSVFVGGEDYETARAENTVSLP
jgi:hypothetical protein